MNTYGKGEFVLLALGLLLSLAFFIFQLRQNDSCGKAGGVYLWREYKCVEGIKEIAP